MWNILYLSQCPPAVFMTLLLNRCGEFSHPSTGSTGMTALLGYRRHQRAIFLVVCGGLSMLLGTSTAPAQTRAEGTEGSTPTVENERASEAESATIRERIVWTFSGYHASTEPGPLLEFGSRSGVIAALKDLASDADMRPSIRLRAVDALGRIGGDEATVFLESMFERSPSASDDRERRIAELLRMHAISSLGRVLDDARAAERLESLWPEADVQTRLTIVETLGAHAGSPGRDALGRLGELAEEQIVKDKIGAKLSR